MYYWCQARYCISNYLFPPSANLICRVRGMVPVVCDISFFLIISRPTAATAAACVCLLRSEDISVNHEKITYLVNDWVHNPPPDMVARSRIITIYPWGGLLG